MLLDFLIFYIYIYIYFNIYIYLYILYVYVCLSIYLSICLSIYIGVLLKFVWVGWWYFLLMVLQLYMSVLYIYKNLYYFIYFYRCQYFFFHESMSFEVQSCVNLNGTNGKEGRTHHEKKSFIDRNTFEAIACKYIICRLGDIR